MSNSPLTNRHKLRVLAGGKAPKYECYLCHAETTLRESYCPRCGALDTLIREEIEAPEERKESRAVQASKLRPKPLKRYASGSPAWDEALGGGFVRPSASLIYGPRGVGKSTRAIAIALHLATLARGKALFGSAEMPAEHVRHYAERSGLSRRELDRLWIQDSSDALDLLANIEQERPAVVVWDSIQRFTWEGELGDTELRLVVHHALEATKHYKLITLLISQVGKEEMFLGPNGIAHDVDTMIALSRDGEDLTVEVPHKNRFAPTPRKGVERFGATAPSGEPPTVPVIDDDETAREWLSRGVRARSEHETAESQGSDPRADDPSK